jgi:hypothetical protein
LRDRNDSQAEPCRPSQKNRDIGGRFEASSDDEDGGADKRRGRQKVDPQNSRNFVEQDVPDGVSSRR